MSRCKNYLMPILLVLLALFLFVGCGSKTEQSEIEYTPEEIEIMEQGYTLEKTSQPKQNRLYTKMIDGVRSGDYVWVFILSDNTVSITRSNHSLSEDDIAQLRERYKDFKIPKGKEKNYEYVFESGEWRLWETKKKIAKYCGMWRFEEYYVDVLTGEEYTPDWK